MFSKIRLEHIRKKKSAAGLEVILLPDGGYELHLIILKKEKSTLLTETQKEAITSFTEVRQLIDPKIPLVVIINGKGIVHRKIGTTEQDTKTSLLNRLLPNANVDDFVIQKTPLHNSEVFVSVIRLNVLNELIQELINSQLTEIAACFLGPFAATNLLPLLSNDAIDNEHLLIGNLRLQIREQQITNIETAINASDEPVRIGNELLPKQLLLAFGAALSYFIGTEEGILNANLLTDLKAEFQQKQKFEFRGWLLLIAAFLILMINYFIFDNYWSKNKDMNAQLQLTQVALQRYDKLKIEFDQKKLFLEQNGLLENSRTSYYADQLAKELPVSMQFTGLDIHPLKKKNPGEDRTLFLFENKLIHVSGNCQRNTELNEWMKKIKKQNWVDDVVLLNYKQDNVRENGFFLVEIKLK